MLVVSVKNGMTIADIMVDTFWHQIKRVTNSESGRKQMGIQIKA